MCKVSFSPTHLCDLLNKSRPLVLEKSSFRNASRSHVKATEPLERYIYPFHHYLLPPPPASRWLAPDRKGLLLPSPTMLLILQSRAAREEAM